MCSEMGVSESGFYSYVRRKGAGPSPKEARDLRDFAMVREAYGYRGYPKGSRTIAMLIPRLFPGARMSRKKVPRLMGKFGLACPVRKANPGRLVSKAVLGHAVFSNKLNRQFAVGRPGYRLLTDVTYVRYGGSLSAMCYLSTPKDASTNEIVAWRLSRTVDLEFVLGTIRDAAALPWMPDQCLVHSDQGSHYTARVYRKLPGSLGMSQSMSRKGNCWDNAPMESWFGHMKDEVPLRRCGSFAEVEALITDYTDYYKNERPQKGLGGRTPAEAREDMLASGPFYPAVVPQDGN